MSIAVPQAQHSTAQPNQPAQSRKASTCRSGRDNASKQIDLARASTRRRAFIQHAEFSKRTKKSKSARPPKICTRYSIAHTALGVVREEFAFSFGLSEIQHCSFEKKIVPPYGGTQCTPSLFYLGYTVPHSIPSRPSRRPINVEYFQAQHPSRANHPININI